MSLSARNRRHCIKRALAAVSWACAAAACTWASAASGAPGAAGGAGAPPVVLVLGDSLSAEYGIARGSGWVALLEKKLADEKRPARIVNASISGETTAGGRSRLPALLALLARERLSVVVIELGANDGLRGLPIATAEANLNAMVRATKQAGAKVLLVGMQVPPNYGRAYAQDFAAMFGRVAKAQGVALVPFLLAGVADAPNAAALFQSDRIHPLAAAQPRMLANVWPFLDPLLK